MNKKLCYDKFTLAGMGGFVGTYHLYQSPNLGWELRTYGEESAQSFQDWAPKFQGEC